MYVGTDFGPFEARLAAAGFALVKVNPRQARRFVEASGRLAKTDRVDAAMLARMGALLDLEARPARSPILNDLKDLHMAREALVKNRTAVRNRAKTLTLAIFKRHNAAIRFAADDNSRADTLADEDVGEIVDVAAATPPIAITAPTERSKPPAIMTMVMPITTMPSTDTRAEQEDIQ